MAMTLMGMSSGFSLFMEANEQLKLILLCLKRLFAVDPMDCRLATMMAYELIIESKT